MLKTFAPALALVMLPTLGLAQAPAPVKAAGQVAEQAAAQAAKPITKQATVTKTLTITGIDQNARSVTLRSENGDEDTFTVGPEVTRFNQLKVGDKIKATYHESLVFQVRRPDAPAATAGTTIVGGRAKDVPGAGLAAEQTTSVTVKAVDMNAPSITVVTEDGHTMTRKIQDKKNLEGVKAGDRIDITYTRALVVKAEPAK
jgi:Cu/Ag efflux protein CusF